jgi:DNA-binding transcriptional MerR regulator
MGKGKGGVAGFSAREVAKLSGAGFWTLYKWRETGFLIPSLLAGPVSERRLAAGRGSTRLYSFPDLIAARVAHDLRDARISLQALRRVVREVRRLKDTGHHPLAAATLVVSGNDVLLVSDHDHLVSLLKQPGQAVWRVVVDLGPVVRKMQQAVATMRREAA